MLHRRYSLVVCFVVSLLLVSACSYDEMWDGVEYEQDGLTLTMAATEPLCGCLRITNKSSFRIHLRSAIANRELGNLDLDPGQSTAAHFDWGGVGGMQYFIIDVWNEKGEQIKASDVLQINDTGYPWQPCVGRIPGQPAPQECPIGPLKMNTGRNQL
jgi:hypothetical protein